MALRNNPNVKAASQALALGLAPDFDLARDTDLAVVRDYALALDLARAVVRDRALDLARAVVRDRDLDRALARDLDRALARARARALDNACGRGRDCVRALDSVRDAASAIGIIVEIRTAEVGRAIGQELCRRPVTLDRDSLHALLDDFTTSDLRKTDLTGVDLSGVYWSEYTTQWPPTMDVEDLKTRSEETPPGSGTWTVCSGTATIRDLADR